MHPDSCRSGAVFLPPRYSSSPSPISSSPLLCSCLPNCTNYVCGRRRRRRGRRAAARGLLLDGVPLFSLLGQTQRTKEEEKRDKKKCLFVRQGQTVRERERRDSRGDWKALPRGEREGAREEGRRRRIGSSVWLHRDLPNYFDHFTFRLPM